MESASVLGVRCFAGSLEAAAQQVAARAGDKAGGYVCFCNVHVLVSSLHDERLRSALDGAWAVFPDGWPVAWLARQSGHPQARRIAGADVMSLVFVLSQSLALRHYLFGSTPGTLFRLRRRFQEGYPAAQIVGAYAPPFGPVGALGAGEIKRIRVAEPDLVWCALGAPKQELWMQRHAEALAPSVLLGVGAAFDFLSGTRPRAPLWMQDSSLEWLHRLAHEPGRLASRYIRTNGEFVARATIEVARRRQRRLVS